MSTHAAIGVKNSDGTIRAVYCHHDGYIDYVGVTLNGFYKTPLMAEALIGLGYLSSLGKKIATEPGMNIRQADDVTVAYHRDMHERLKPAVTFRDEMDYARRGRQCFGADYLYLFDGTQWTVFESGASDGFIDLALAIGAKANQ